MPTFINDIVRTKHNTDGTITIAITRDGQTWTQTITAGKVQTQAGMAAWLLEQNAPPRERPVSERYVIEAHQENVIGSVSADLVPVWVIDDVTVTDTPQEAAEQTYRESAPWALWTVLDAVGYVDDELSALDLLAVRKLLKEVITAVLALRDVAGIE